MNARKRHILDVAERTGQSVSDVETAQEMNDARFWVERQLASIVERAEIQRRRWEAREKVARKMLDGIHYV